MEPKTENKQKSILFHAYKEFSKHGYLNTTTKDIAKVAGINESTLFRQFESKEKLFDDVLENYDRVAFEEFADLDAQLTHSNFQQDLPILLQKYYELTYRYIDLLRIFYINAPFITFKKQAFYVLPNIRLHFSDYLYRYFFDYEISREQLDFYIELFLNHITRFVSDLYGHDYLYELTSDSQKMIDDEINKQIQLFRGINKKALQNHRH